MNEIFISDTKLPILSDCGFLAASESFYHIDRIAPFNILIFVTKGVIYVTEDNTDYEIHQGEMLFLKAGLHHFGKLLTPKGTCWYYAHFTLEAHENNFERQVPKKLFELSDTKTKAKLSKLSKAFFSNNEKEKWFANSMLFEILSDCIFAGITPAAPETLSDKISAFLDKNYNKKFSAKALEKEFYLSYKHLAAVYKKEKNMTMQEYHTGVKMDYCCRLLKSTLMTIGEISEAAGYTDKLYFSRQFHKTKGFSPSEYRKKNFIY